LRERWETLTPRQRRRGIHAGAGIGAFILHLGLLLVLKPDPHFHDPPAIDEYAPAVLVTLVRPPPRQAPPNRAATQSRATVERQPAAAPVAGPTRRPDASSVPLSAPPAPPAGAATPGRNPGRQQAVAGVAWGQAPADGAGRRTLRMSAGCGLGIPLTRAEQAFCDERMGADWKKRREGPPLMADRARQREFEREADYKMRLREYKGDSMPPGHFEKLRDMGGQPPRK
jgi:hypothetical protein